MSGDRTRQSAAARREDAEVLARLTCVRDLVRLACTRFSRAGLAHGHGTDNALDEAIWLVCASLALPIERYAELADARLEPREVRRVLALVRARCETRAPLAYLLGEAWLCGFRFRADSRALVPRSPIVEALLAGSLEPWLGAREPATILDLCTGGGSIAIVAATRFPDARVVATDLSVDALALAAENIAMHDLGERIELRQGDLLDALGDERFELILCNPPYVNEDSMRELPPEYTAEPRIALAGGDDGMVLIERILQQVPANLAEGGLLVLEMGHEANAFEHRFPRLVHAWIEVAAGERQIAAIASAALGQGATIRA